MKKITKIAIASFTVLPFLFLAIDYQLVSIPAYCINRYRLITNLSSNSSPSNGLAANVYGCVARANKLTADEKILEGYEYKPNIDNSMELKELRLEGSSYFSEVFGECAIKNKCIIAKFHVHQVYKSGFAKSYFSYVILVKDANGKINKTNESYIDSPLKG